MQLLNEKEKKIQEIENTLINYISNDDERKNILNTFLENGFINITPPEEEKKEEKFIQFITLDANFSKNGVSRKPGNIVLNIKNLIKGAPDLISAIHDFSSTTSDQYILGVRLGLVIWNKLLKNYEIDIDKDSSLILYTLWRNCDYNNEINEELAYLKVNSMRELYRMNKLTIKEYSNIINNLSIIKCILVTNGVIRLVEGVKIKY